jgi:hypothetical protein
MKNLSQALVKFQSQLKPVAKESENPFFNIRSLNTETIPSCASIPLFLRFLSLLHFYLHLPLEFETTLFLRLIEMLIG